MHRRFLLLLPALLLIFAAPNDEKPIFGFTSANAAKEHALEAQFDSHLNRDDLRAWMKRLSARPHHLGSAYDHDNQLFVESLFKSWGYDPHIERFAVRFPTPKTRLVELVAPERYTAKLAEAPLPQDATGGQPAEQLPVSTAYSVAGDVTGDLVYVNYGIPADYDQLERRGVDVKGKIVIARYGGSWRGIKPKVAAEHGAIGCIIYSDPRDDGYFQGDVYPKGAYRNDTGAQRGSVMDMPVHPGDPLTPGVGATKNAKRLDIKDVDVLTKIPVLPISYGDALPLLRALGGPGAPPDWAGARAHQARLQLEHRARVRRRGAPRRQRARRRVGHARQPLRRVGQRRAGSDQRPRRGARRGARDRRAGEDWMEAEADDHVLRLGRRGGRPPRLDRVGRGACRRAAAARRRLHQHRLQRTRLLRRRRLAHARAADHTGGARRRRSRAQRLRARAQARARSLAHQLTRGAEGLPRARAHPPRCPRLGLRLPHVPAARRRRRDERRLRRRGRRRVVPLDLRLVRSLHPLHRSELRLRRGSGEDGWSDGAAPGGCGRAAVRVHDVCGHDVALPRTAARPH